MGAEYVVALSTQHVQMLWPATMILKRPVMTVRVNTNLARAA